MRKAPVWIGLAMLVAGAIWGGIHWRKDGHEPSMRIDTEALLNLEPFGEFDPSLHFTRDLSVVFYFSELSCNTCTTKELENMADWYSQFGDRVDFYLVVHGQDRVFLNNLKRLGKVDYPILMETSFGQMGLGRTTIALFRKNTQQVLARYFPTPDQVHLKDLARFEARLHKELSGRIDAESIDETT